MRTSAQPEEPAVRRERSRKPDIGADQPDVIVQNVKNRTRKRIRSQDPKRYAVRFSRSRTDRSGPPPAAARPTSLERPPAARRTGRERARRVARARKGFRA